MHRVSFTTGLVLVLVAACSRGHEVVRVATYNVSFYRPEAGQLVRDLSNPSAAQPKLIAEVIQRVRPEIILLNEFDYDSGGTAVELFQRNFLERPQNVSGSPDSTLPIYYEHSFFAPVNTGVSTGFDLNNDGKVGVEGREYGNDAFGFGTFPGQYGMVILSRYPIDSAGVRTFQKFLWKDMPGALLPTDPSTGRPWYDHEEVEVFRLSSKSHWDVPVIIADTIHLLTSHPTPPIFDGDEDRNGLRNADEIKFWVDYTTPGVEYMYDDNGVRGGLGSRRFVIMGDLNSDPVDGAGGIDRLLNHPSVNTEVIPTSEGGVEQALLQAGVNTAQRGNPAFDTADFFDGDGGPGNLRIDYVVPSLGLRIEGSGVFWPVTSSGLSQLLTSDQNVGTDHRLVWVDMVFGK